MTWTMVVTLTEREERKNWFGSEDELDFRVCELEDPGTLPGKK